MGYNKIFQNVCMRIINLGYKIIFRVKVTGRENIPEGGAVVCANHPCMADVFFVTVGLTAKYPVGAIAKKELFKNKFLSKLFISLGAFPVDRGRGDISAIRQCLSIVKEGRKLIMFPEGTRTRNSGKKAKAGIGLIAMKSNCPILPIYMSEEIKAFKKTKVIIGKPIYPPKREERVSSEDFAQHILDEIFKLGEQDESRSC